MVFRTIVVGHSQTPTHIPNDGEFEYVILRRPGGLISHLDCPPLSRVYDIPADLIVVFLGGNDIAHHKGDPIALSHKLRDVLLDLKDFAREIAFVSIESREYQEGNRFGISTQEYEDVRNRVTRNVKRYCRLQSFRYINVNRSIFIDNLSPDGVHFNSVANAELIRKIQLLAQHAKERL